MRRLILITFLFAILSPLANAAGLSGRKPGLYGVLGLDRTFTSYKGETNRSEFSGWGVTAEAGVDFVSNQDYGLNFAGIYRQGDDKNKASTESNIEIGESSGYGAKIGFIISYLTIGGGFWKTNFKSIQVNGASGASEASSQDLSGQQNFLFANLTFDIASRYRSMVELSYGQGKAGDVDTTMTTLSLKIGILESSR